MMKVTAKTITEPDGTFTDDDNESDVEEESFLVPRKRAHSDQPDPNIPSHVDAAPEQKKPKRQPVKATTRKNLSKLSSARGTKVTFNDDDDTPIPTDGPSLDPITQDILNFDNNSAVQRAAQHSAYAALQAAKLKASESADRAEANRKRKSSRH